MWSVPCNPMRNLEVQLEKLLSTFSIKTKYGAMAATVTAIVIFASIYIGFGYARRAWKAERKLTRVYRRSVSLAALHGGKLAWDRLTDYNHAQANAKSLNKAETDLRKLLAGEHPDFCKLQSIAAKLEMSGKEAVAEKILKRALEKTRDEGKSHEAYEIEMLLVEMYIYKGDPETASSCDCLKHEEISDARRPLYKAIIHVMLQHPREEAVKCWEEFKEIREQFLVNPSLTTLENIEFRRGVEQFEEFEKAVTSIKRTNFINAP